MGRWLSPSHWLRSCCLGVILLVALFGGLAWLCGSLLARHAEAAELSPLDLMLVVDNSQSCWPLEGAGTDPTGLRLAAAQLAIEYLGVDTARLHRVGLMFFGTQPEEVVPAGLLEAAQRARLIAGLGQARPAGWTDTAAALRLAEAAFQTEGDRQSVVVLFTDGTPYVEGRTEAELLAELAAVGAQYQARGITLSVVLLQSAPSEADLRLEVFWRELTATTGGRVVVASSADALPTLYHELMAGLLGRTTTTTLETTILADSTMVEQRISLPEALAEATIVFWSDTRVRAQLLTPAGGPVGPPQEGEGLLTWQLSGPVAGDWQMTLSAMTPGAATVWVDGVPAVPALPATPPPTPLRASRTATRAPTATPRPTPTFLPTATFTARPYPTPITTPTVLIATPALPAAVGKVAQNGGWLRYLLPLGVAGVAGGWWWRRQGQHSEAFLGDTLIELPGGQRIPLEGLGQMTTLGPLRLRAAYDATGDPVTLASGEELHIQGRAVTSPQPLWDGDILTVGQQSWRYDNLTRRRRKTQL